MLKKFAQKEKLKDHLLYLIKQGEEDNVGLNIIEPTSDILIRVFDVYKEIIEEKGAIMAGDYLFNLLAIYILMSTQLTDVNEQLINVNEELVKTNEKLLREMDS